MPPMIEKITFSTTTAIQISGPRKTQIRPTTGMNPKIRPRIEFATSRPATLMPQLRASLPSTLDLAPRSLKISQMMSGATKDRMLPK